MGIYSTKFQFESAVEDSIQTPGDSIDLDQIEKNIAGEDGIESHRDDIEDAQDGVVGDPLEEAYNIMYEAEYNWNQIMYCIGMHELREASYGREVIYEAVDIKGFFNNIKKIFQKMFEGITKAVTTVLAKLDFQLKADKKFVAENKTLITRGADKNWEFEGYVFPKGAIKFPVSEGDFTNPQTYIIDIGKTLNSMRAGRVSEEDIDRIKATFGSNSDKFDGWQSVSIERVSGVQADDVSEMVKRLNEKLFGKKQDLKGKVDVQDIIDTLANDRDTTAIRKTYKDIKKSYNESIKTINEWEKNISAKDYTDENNNMSVALTICNQGSAMMKFEKSALNSVYACYMKAAKAKRSQARALAHKFVSLAKKDEVQHNSANMYSGSTFGKINLI